MKKLMWNLLSLLLNQVNIKDKPSHLQTIWTRLILVQSMNLKQTKILPLDNITLMKDWDKQRKGNMKLKSLVKMIADIKDQLKHLPNLDNIKLKLSLLLKIWRKLILVQNMNSSLIETQHLDNMMLMLLKEQPWPDHTKLRLLVMKKLMWNQLSLLLNQDNIKQKQ